MGITKKIDNEYFLLDKIIITEGSIFNFNIFIKTPQDTLQLAYTKQTKVTKDLESKLRDKQQLYINNSDKNIYLKLYRQLKYSTTLSDKLIKHYIKFSEKMDTIFEYPETLETITESKIIVTNMINTILSQNFQINSFIETLSYDFYTYTHSVNVCAYALCLGKYLGLNTNDLEDLGTAALLHDIGQSKIQKIIINKNARFIQKDLTEVRKHPILGYDLAKRLHIKSEAVLLGIRQHHEKMDGSGYPDGLKGYQIHLFAKIIAICDIFDALTTNKSYQDSISTFDALVLMRIEMSKELDMNILNSFIQMLHSKDAD